MAASSGSVLQSNLQETWYQQIQNSNDAKAPDTPAALILLPDDPECPCFKPFLSAASFCNFFDLAKTHRVFFKTVNCGQDVGLIIHNSYRESKQSFSQIYLGAPAMRDGEALVFGKAGERKDCFRSEDAQPEFFQEPYLTPDAYIHLNASHAGLALAAQLAQKTQHTVFAAKGSRVCPLFSVFTPPPGAPQLLCYDNETHEQLTWIFFPDGTEVLLETDPTMKETLLSQKIESLRQIAESGDADAHLCVAQLLAERLREHPESADEIAYRFLAAAERGSAFGQYNLGIAFAQGLYGLPVDLDAAKLWLQRASDQGVRGAKRDLENLSNPKQFKEIRAKANLQEFLNLCK